MIGPKTPDRAVPLVGSRLGAARLWRGSRVFRHALHTPPRRPQIEPRGVGGFGSRAAGRKRTVGRRRGNRSRLHRSGGRRGRLPLALRANQRRLIGGARARGSRRRLGTTRRSTSCTLGERRHGAPSGARPPRRDRRRRGAARRRPRGDAGSSCANTTPPGAQYLVADTVLKGLSRPDARPANRARSLRPS